ncbi:MAG TPA: FHA domain-containing serine/threonine-protein kinase [Solirubrobacteraceae bacterium]|jgi:pSer/pThr/pTyr-binding forkhead associated (FHA) protein/predicted Ser/Thr protein kinase|nr:FHA domain-containing serine/threonine-protein kinase [Solirubrobacteraceae bacterium]
MAGEQLRVTEGKARGKRLSVDTDLLIGRLAPEQDGRLGDDPVISRRHARVWRGADGQLTIEDLGSANGTFVNDERLDARRTLNLGDVIRVGKTVLQVSEPSALVPERSRPGTGSGPAEAPSAPAGAGEALVVTVGTAEGRRLTLTDDELIIGRGVSGQGLLSDDGQLSRRHARVARDASGQLTIEDLGSANGTFVNGKRADGPQALKVGDSIRVGLTTLELTHVGTPPSPPVPPPPLAAPVSPTPLAAAAPPTPLPARPKRPQTPAAPAPDRAVLGSELPVDSVFAGCRVQEVIGHGDMGVVYRAEELALQRRVALKLILPEHSRDDRFRERFRRESRIAAAIDHPNVIPIFDAGDESGVLFITMRLVNGTDLRALIAAEGRIEPIRAARIVRQVGAGLDAAHARGMLHRDVKPSNVLLAREDHVYLSDFGLAKRQSASAVGLTRHGSIVARAEYVAPEQVLNERVDARADIYTLGCLLFESLTGEAPFARWDGGPEALGHVSAPRPSVTELCPDLPREFDEVVRRAMATDPSERYPSAGDLGRAALVAAGGLRKARAWSVVATGEAAPARNGAIPEETAAAPATRAPERATAIRGGALRWAIAVAGLVAVAVGMVAALMGISTL